jgi:magnesium chelatase family protein
MLATVLSATVQGLDGLPVHVEVDLQRGLRCFNLVGLPSLAVRESRERVTAALLNSGFTLPERRITVNLAPADLPKDGAAFDVAIALGVLQASKQCDLPALDRVCVLGELALDGTIRPTRGVVPIAIALQGQGIERALVPEENWREAALAPGLDVVPCRHLRDAVDAVAGRWNGRPRVADVVARAAETAPSVHFGHVYGQELAKRALGIAAAGGHHVLMVGPPGVGKSMLARCLPALLPPLSATEGLETRQVLSVCGEHALAAAPIVQRPFRAPHHTLSVPALVGGGRPVVPGEITRAHNGVLFLDELPEFPRHLLDLLRQPLEDGAIRLSRANQQITFPARFQLVAAMNPCKCGWLGHPRRVCKCTPAEVARYRARVSGPILDRIDLRVDVTVPPARLIGGRDGDTEEARRAHAALRARIGAARERQTLRYAQVPGVYCNAQAGPEVRERIRPRREATELLLRAVSRWNLSVRAYERTLAVARSIADVDGASDVGTPHVAEALQYRVIRTSAGDAM